MHYFKIGLDGSDFIFTKDVRKKLCNLLKYGLEGKICNHYERLFVLQVAV